jgi:hypothetical protein
LGNGVPSAKSGKHLHPISEREQAIYLVWLVICFVVLGSTIIHGLSPVATVSAWVGALVGSGVNERRCWAKRRMGWMLWFTMLMEARVNLRLVERMKNKGSGFEGLALQ